ncbi:MAG: hypothetical protein VKN72_01940 [Nostocales cyanobacterium 94392]|nr:hypothetical protein [Nostocales cyanobacterium 94392]
MKSANRWLFLGVGVIVLIVFGYGGYQIGRYFLTKRITSNLVSKEIEKDNNIKISLGSFRELEGTPYLMAPVNSQENHRQSYYDTNTSRAYNYLFFNANDKSAQRLVNSNNFLFLNAQEVVLERRDDKIVTGMWYEVVKADSNNDRRLDEKDKKTISISDVSGSDYTEVIDEIDRLLGYHQKNSTTLLVFYEFDGREYVAEISIVRRVLVEKQVLPSIK